ncbi:MAG TPA: hypothetical protein VFD25_03420 [Clostridia bacterium]|nr:hypothetical protein [Clostridia bacterium]
MTSEMIVAVFSLAGTLIGTFGGIIASAKLTNYRIVQLEKKVDKHNGFATRIPIIEEQIKITSSRVCDLEERCYR